MWWSDVMAHQNTRILLFSRPMCVVLDVCTRHHCVFMRQLFFNHLISFYISWWVQKPIYVKVSIVDTHNIQAQPHSGPSILYVASFGVRDSSIAKENCVPTVQWYIYYIDTLERPRTLHCTPSTFDMRRWQTFCQLPTTRLSPCIFYIFNTTYE